MALFSTFYAEYTPSPSSWRAPQPVFDAKSFNKALIRRCGFIGEHPRFRLRWAGDAPEYIIEEGLVHTGYTYKGDCGKEIFVSITQRDFEFPDGALVSPYFEDTRIYVPRWVVEEMTGDAYEKAWFVEETEWIDDGNGGYDKKSYYLAPGEWDLAAAEKLAYNRDHLNADDYARGLAIINDLKDRRNRIKRDELVDDIAEETAKALTDGLPERVSIDLGRAQPRKDFNIGTRISEVIEKGRV